MIRILIFAILLSACSTPRKLETGRDFEKAYRWQRAIAPAALSFAGGVCYGFHETVVHHPDRIPANWNKQWWDSRQSWRNKYKDGDPVNGPAWFGAEYVTFGQDAKHTFATGYRYTTLAAGICIGLGQRRPAWHYAADIGISFVCAAVGFHGIYSGFFKK
ncbi:MAG: hypothetical protein IPN33_25650 [Saprospiraceae bacterium]|nr:hypothetical protein [Saprospiraceae bacterium]